MPKRKRSARKLTEDEALAIQCERSGEEGYMSAESFLKEMGYGMDGLRLPSASDAEDEDDMRVAKQREKQPLISLEKVLAEYGR